jgi:hypothetical protein
MNYIKTVISVLFIATANLANGTTIQWGSNPGEVLYDSTGAALSASYSFEIGTFGSFVPTEFNMNDWATNWTIFGQATSANGWNPNTPFLTSSANLNSDSSSSQFTNNFFPVGSQAYIWAFNTKNINPGSTEWALVTNTSADGNALDDWLFPNPDPSQSQPGYNWRFDSATSVPFGGLKGVQGPGNFSSTPPGTFAFQTHVVPEPSGLALLGIIALVPLTRRRR